MNDGHVSASLSRQNPTYVKCRPLHSPSAPCRRCPLGYLCRRGYCERDDDERCSSRRRCRGAGEVCQDGRCVLDRFASPLLGGGGGREEDCSRTRDCRRGYLCSLGRCVRDDDDRLGDRDRLGGRRRERCSTRNRCEFGEICKYVGRQVASDLSNCF